MYDKKFSPLLILRVAYTACSTVLPLCAMNLFSGGDPYGHIANLRFTFDARHVVILLSRALRFCFGILGMYSRIWGFHQNC